MTPLPNRVMVGARIYTITRDKDYLDREAELIDASEGLYGHTNNVVMEIVLDPESGPIRLKETLLHELMHAVMDMAGLDELLGHEREEEVALRTAPILLDVLRRNPKFVAFLLS